MTKLKTNIGKKADYMNWNPERIGALILTPLGSEVRYISSNFRPTRVFTPVFLQNVNNQLHLDKPNKSHSHTKRKNASKFLCEACLRRVRLYIKKPPIEWRQDSCLNIHEGRMEFHYHTIDAFLAIEQERKMFLPQREKK